jgi:PAS domain S-box-containing protein
MGNRDRGAQVTRPAPLALGEVADALPFAVLVTDEGGEVVESNAAAHGLFGADGAGLVGSDITSLMPERYRRTLHAALEVIARDRLAFTWEQQIEGDGRESMPVEVSAFPLRDGLVGWVLQDVRDRVVMERRLAVLTADLEGQVEERTHALETERARLAAVMSQMPAGLLIVDAQGQVVTANDEALRILRVDDLAAAGVWQDSTTSDAPDAPEEQPLARALLRDEVVTGERAEVVAGDGARIVVEINASPVRDSAGQLLGAACIFSDVTLRERREQAEREFVTNAAHELQTPLAALVSAVEVLVGGAKDTPERDLFLEHIARESERLTRLIRALLTLARAEMGTDGPTVGIVPLCPLLERVADEIKPAPGVSVSVTCGNEVAAIANAELLEQALVNVAENAAKYTVRGRISLEGRQQGDAVEITVTDTGAGIPPADRSLVFDRFHRGSTGSGSGLGLAIVRSIMDALGGEVGLDSEIGGGTTVKLRLPGATVLVEA